MRFVKPRLKKVLLVAGIIALVGVGASLIAGKEKNEIHFKQAVVHVQPKPQAPQAYIVRGERDFAGPGDVRARIMHIEGGPHHKDWDAGIAIGGTLLAAGLLFWFIKRRKKSNGPFESTVTVIPSTADFLDQWENNLTTKKETN